MHKNIKHRLDDIVSQRLRLMDLSKILKEPAFLLMCFCMFAYTGSEVGVWGWLSSLLQQKVFFSELLSGLGVSLFWLFMTIGRTISGWLLPRTGAKNLVVMLAIFSTIVSLAAVFIVDWKILLILIAGIGLGCSSQFPLIAAIGSRLTKLPSGAAFTILIVSGSAGSSVIPYLMGLTGNIFGLDKSLLIPVVLFALISLSLLIGPVKQFKERIQKQS